MSVPFQIDLRAAASVQVPIRGLAQPIAEQAERNWLCSFCGLLRAYEGGCPGGQGRQNDCRECGGRLAPNPEDRAVIAQCDMKRRGVRALVDADMF